MIKCPNCTYENEATAQICTSCGELLIAASMTHIIEEDKIEDVEPKYGPVRFRNSLILDVIDSQTSFVFDRDEIQELIIGREDPDTGEKPPVDLTDENGLELGVSRNHAMIVRRDGALHIMDNSSANGTFLNGQKLVTQQFRVLRDGDDIKIGKLILRVEFN